MSTSRSSAGYAPSRLQQKRKDSGLFWWTVLITVLLGVATFSWFFSIYLFAHPEKPLNYRILTKLEKLEPPKPYSALNVPSGRFFNAKEIYAKYFGFSGKHLGVENSLLKRHYLWNFRDEGPVYLKGTFRISQVRRLTASDVFPNGFVARARSREYPTVVVEYIFPCDQAIEEGAAVPFTVGDDLSLDRSSTFASLLHIEKLRDDHLSFTVVPLVYGTYEVAGVGAFSLSPPTQLNMDGSWPLTEEGAGAEEPVARVAQGG